MRTISSTSARLPWGVYVLSLAQALNLTAAVISVTVAALVGAQIANTPALATVPYGAQFAAVMLCTYPVSMLMRRLGRRPVFYLGALLLITSGAVGYIAVAHTSFSLLILSHVLLGSYIACANFYRFAAVDTLPEAVKARGISLVVAGGVLAAIIGPALANGLRHVVGYIDFSLCYAALCVLGLATLLLISLWRSDSPIKSSQQNKAAGNLPTKLDWALPTAILTSAWGYLAMNLLMVQASLVMKDICTFDASSRAIQAHVLAMFLPSFFTGWLINRLGLHKVLFLGYALLISAGIFGMTTLSYFNVLIDLVLLGVGWNFTYVGGGALLAQHLTVNNRHRWQGLNDTVIAACATLGAFLPAPLLALIGWNMTNGLVILLTILSVIFCWQVFRNKNKTFPGTGLNAS